MKDILRQIYYRISDNKIEFASYTCAIVGILIIIFWDQISKFFPPGRVTQVWTVLMLSFISLLFGVVGVTFIIMKKAPIFIIPIRGIPAIIIGLFLALGFFGGAIWGIIVNYPLLTGH